MVASKDPAYNLLAKQFMDIGLGELVGVDSRGNPRGWLWEQIQAGFEDEQLMVALEQTDVFADRFSVIVEQKRRAAKGEAVYVMSPGEVIEYEQKVKTAMVAAGLPKWFYDEPDDFSNMILSGISAAEFVTRVDEAFTYVDNAPPEVRAKFEEYYGVAQGDAALASYILDPSKTTAQLSKATRTAYTAGMAKRFDIELNRVTAERIEALGMTDSGVVQGLSQVASMNNVFDNGLFEDGSITADDGVAAVFDGDADAQRDIDQRRARRAAVNQAATGGAVLTNRGLTGAGSASR